MAFLLIMKSLLMASQPVSIFDKALVSQIAPLLPTLAELIGDDALNGMGQLVKSILKAFPEAMEKTTKFEVGLKLIK